MQLRRLALCALQQEKSSLAAKPYDHNIMKENIFMFEKESASAK
jgi:hypothetical protein